MKTKIANGQKIAVTGGEGKTGSGALLTRWRSPCSEGVFCVVVELSLTEMLLQQQETAIQSLPVSWLRRFPRNELIVFSLVLSLFCNIAALRYAG